MPRIFNIAGCCEPEIHYMVNLTSRLSKTKDMVDAEMYFTMNRARQFGKTTTLTALADHLSTRYIVVSMDFQTLSSLSYENEQSFVSAFAGELLELVDEFPEEVEKKLLSLAERTEPFPSLQMLFKILKSWCIEATKRIVLIIDEVDTASNAQVFVDFLAQLRACYLKRRRTPTFQSVILAGVYDIHSVKNKINPDGEHLENSPWNIAASFDLDMSFSSDDIAGMLTEYETDLHTGMDISQMARLIYNCTAGYPYLVSALCKYIDEKVTGSTGFEDKKRAWTKEGFYEAYRMIVKEDWACKQQA